MGPLEPAMAEHRLKAGTVYGVLAVILVVFAALTVSIDATTVFGDSHDETLYLSSAKSIAAGDGYTAANLPGTPPQTKYPPLYSYLLAVVWLFSSNLQTAVVLAQALNIALSGLWLVGVFYLLRGRCSDKVALGVTAIVAVQPISSILAARILSDVGFAALLTWSCVLAQRASARRVLSIVGMALVCAATTALRTLGVFGAIGIAGWAVTRRRYALAATAIIAGTLPLVLKTSGVSPPLPEGLPGFAQNWIYYTDYTGFWQLSIADFETLKQMIIFNVTELLKAPAADVFHLKSGGYAPGPLQALAVALSAGIFSGLWRDFKDHGLNPLLAALPAYIIVLLVWNYTIMERFLLPFLPLFLFGAWRELAAIGGGLIAVFRERKPLLDRGISVVMAGLLIWLIGYASVRTFYSIPSAMAAARSQRADSLRASTEAYHWIKSHTDTSDTIIAWEDGKLFLETDRQAIRPAAFRTSAFYTNDMEILMSDLARLDETARAVNARYWLAAPGDYSLASAKEIMRESQNELLSRAPVVFESQDGTVRVHDVAAISGAAPLKTHDTASLLVGESSK